jgi:hypothetical protein
MDYNLLKLRHRAERAHYPHHVSLRVDRTLNWFYRSKSCQNNPDGQFIVLWIVFNAANWQENFQKAKHQTNMALAKQHTAKIIERIPIIIKGILENPQAL